MGLKLDLGGVGRGGEYTTVNLDTNLRRPPDIVCDIRDLSKVCTPDTVDQMRCTHTLEHLPAGDILPTLRHWRNFLRVGGTLDLKVPDLGRIAAHYVQGQIPFEVFASIAYVPGSRVVSDLEDHHWGWDVASLRSTLRRAGYYSPPGLYPDPAFLEPGYWIYDFEELGYTGLVGKYCVPDLVVRAIRREFKTTNSHIFVLHYDDGNRRGIRKTQSCLQSILASMVADIKAVHLIRAGDSALPEVDYAALFKEKGADFTVHSTPNISLGHSFQTVLREVPDYDVAILVTNDTQLAPSSHPLANLLAALTLPDVGIVAPGTNDRGAGQLFVPYPSNWASLEMEHVDNTFWAIRSDVFEAVGEFDYPPDHKASWYLNRDFCLRARRCGYRVLAVRRAFVAHDHDGGYDFAAEKAGQEWFRRKWGFLI